MILTLFSEFSSDFRSFDSRTFSLFLKISAEIHFPKTRTIPRTHSAAAYSPQPNLGMFLTKPILPVNPALDTEAVPITQQVRTLVPAYPRSRPQTHHLNRAPCPLDQVNIPARNMGEQAKFKSSKWFTIEGL